MKKIIIFGTGEWGYRFFRSVMNTHEVVAFADNNVSLQGKDLLGVPIVSPSKLVNMSFDLIYVAVASLVVFNSIKKQIVGLGVSEKKICYTEDTIQNMRSVVSSICEFYCEKIINDKIEEFEIRWKCIKLKYKKIFVHYIQVSAMGEMIMSYNSAISKIKNSPDDVLYLFFPVAFDGTGYGVSNWYIFNLMNSNHFIFKDEDLLFWNYVIAKHYREDILVYGEACIKAGMPSFIVETGNTPFEFSNEEIARGENFLNSLSVKKPYVCFAARSSEYKDNLIGGDMLNSWLNNMIAPAEVRNMDFFDYSKGIGYLYENGVQAIHMGRGTVKRLPVNCIDYASNYADEFMDWYLIANCDFAVVNFFGFSQMVAFMHKPQLLVNGYPLTIGFSGANYTKFDIFLPQKMYDVTKGRFLTLRESLKMEFEERKYNNPRSLEELGIKAIKNTADEIKEATEEMYLQITGKWKDTIEDIENARRFEKIMDEFKKIVNHSPAVSREHGPVPCPMSLTFMRRNPWILE